MCVCERERENQKAATDTHKPCHYTILIAGKIHSMKFCEHVKCLHLYVSLLFCSVVVSLDYTFAFISFSFFHICVCIAIPCFFSVFSSLFSINSTQLCRLGLLAIAARVWCYLRSICVRAFKRKYSMDFFSFLEKEHQQHRPNLVQSANWNFIFGPFFAIEFQCNSQHNCSRCYKTGGKKTFFYYNWLCNYLVSDYLL